MLTYLFSVGPVLGLGINGWIPLKYEKPVVAFYQPVVWLMNHAYLEKAAATYIQWWQRTIPKAR